MKIPVSAFTILACLCFNTVIAQTSSAVLPIDPDTKKITYRDIVTQEGNPGYLYDKAIQWFNYYYLSPASVFRSRTGSTGKLKAWDACGFVMLTLKPDQEPMGQWSLT